MADQRVPDELMGVAMQNPRFQHIRQKHGHRDRKGLGSRDRKEGRGRGSGNYRVRPGLGASSEVGEWRLGLWEGRGCGRCKELLCVCVCVCVCTCV